MTLYRIHVGATNRPDIGVVHDGMSLKEAMALLPEGEGLHIMEGADGSILFGVPVKMCHHGFYVAHHISYKMALEDGDVYAQQCDGAGLP